MFPKRFSRAASEVAQIGWSWTMVQAGHSLN